MFVEQGETITTQMDEGFTGVRIYLTKITDGIDAIIDGQKDQATKDDIARLENLIRSQSVVQSSGVSDEAMDEGLTNAMSRAVRDVERGVDAAKGVMGDRTG